MKTNIVLLACIFSLGMLSCSVPQDTPLTDAEKASIKDEMRLAAW